MYACKLIQIGTVAALAVCSCGYRFTAGGSPLPEGIHSVCAPLLANKTAEPGLEAVFTEALRERLERSGVLGGADCDGRIEGEIVALGGAPVVLGASGGPASYRLVGTAHLKLLRGPKAVNDIQVTGTEDYLPAAAVLTPTGALLGGGDVLTTEANRQAALHRLAREMMHDGYVRLATSF